MNENFNVVVKAEYSRIIFDDESNYFIALDKNSDWIVLNEKGKQLLKSPTYIFHIYDTLFSLSEKKGQTLVSLANSDVKISAYAFVRSSMPLIPCRKSTLFEYIDMAGNPVFQGMYFKRAYGFFEEMSVNIDSDWNWVVIDKSGNYKFGKDFNYIGQKFSEGLLFAEDKNGKTGYVDAEGNFKIIIKTVPGSEDNAVFSNFYDDVALVNTIKNGVCLINKEGEYLRKNLGFSYFYDFCNGLALFMVSNDKSDSYNYIDIEGNILSESNFEYAQNFHNGWAAVLLNGKDAIINTKGDIYFLENLDGTILQSD